MFKTRKRIKRLVALGLCVMMLASAGMMASAASTSYSFRFDLKAGGDKQQTSARTKEDYKSYAVINFLTCQNASNFSLPFRLRSGTNNTEASELYYLNGTGKRYPIYKSGYGLYDHPYYFRIQTDSSSLCDAFVSGFWEP